MKRFTLGLALLVSLAFMLVPGPAAASGQRFVHQGFVHRGFVGSPCCARAFPRSHVFVRRHFVAPVVVSPFVVSPFVAVTPAPALVFVPGFWSWNGFTWVW